MNELQNIYKELNDTYVKLSETLCIHQIIEKQAQKTPNSIAVNYVNKKITYEELNKRAERLAALLVYKGVKVGSVVAIMTPRSIEMIVAILAILKTGAAYLPIGCTYPTERVLYILKDSNVKFLLTMDKFLNNSFNICSIDINRYIPDSIQYQERNVTSQNIAYIIYTSGSTGNPKGVAICHQSLINRLYWFINKYSISEKDFILQKTTYTFDVSVWEYMVPLMVGGCVCLLETDKEYFPSSILNAIEKYKISVIHFVPSAFYMFLKYTVAVNELKKIETLRNICCSGETLLKKHLKLFYEMKNQCGTEILLSNLYGPTEATIDVSFYDCTENDLDEEVPIGRPISNMRMYVIKENRIAKVGEQGEICLAGVGLAKCYINDNEKTSKAFKKLGFIDEPRVYMTGDIGYLNENGQIMFCGRKDRQIKLRGYRIELDEIENALMKLPYIQETAVVTEGKEENKKIIAYIVVNRDIATYEIRKHLKPLLLEYCMPDRFVFKKYLPKISSGKVARNRLFR